MATAPLISLKCPNCGGTLTITLDMDVLACGYCGAQQMVRREGGTVSLKLIGEAVAAVKANTDRIASELAISRLRHELAEADKEIERLEAELNWLAQPKNHPKPELGSELFAAILSWLLCFFVFNFPWWSSLLIAFFVLVVLGVIRMNLLLARKKSALKARKTELTERSAIIRAEIKTHLATLS